MEYGELVSDLIDLIHIGAVRAQATQDIKKGLRIYAHAGEILTKAQFEKLLALHPHNYTEYVRITSNRLSN